MSFFSFCASNFKKYFGGKTEENRAATLSLDPSDRERDKQQTEREEEDRREGKSGKQKGKLKRQLIASPFFNTKKTRCENLI